MIRHSIGGIHVARGWVASKLRWMAGVTHWSALLELINKYKVELIAIGNGTASRETDSFVGDLIRDHKLSVTKVMVSESGASIYSASELAAKEFPAFDVPRKRISVTRKF